MREQNKTMRKPTFEIRKAKIGGQTFYQVREPSPDGGPSKRRTFRLKSDAKTFVAKAKVQQENYGAAAFAISDTLRTDAVRAAELLKDTGATLTEAARFFKAAHDSKQNGIPIAEAVTRYLASRRGEIKNKAHKETLASRLNLFATAAAGKNTTTITPEDIESFLEGLTFEPRTKSHYWTHIRSLFAFCRKKGWAAANPAEDVSRPKVIHGDIAILTPQQAALLLASCDERIRAGVAIAMFCGLRKAEIARLDWQAIDFEQGQITLGAAQAKTNSRRVVPLRKNARAWLLPLRKASGPVWPAGETPRDLWTQARILAGFGPFEHTSKTAGEMQKKAKGLTPWPANALRHSAISYNLAGDPNLARVAYESGNSPGVVQKHYNGLASPAAAKKFFAIMPPANSKIVRFAA